MEVINVGDILIDGLYKKYKVYKVTDKYITIVNEIGVPIEKIVPMLLINNGCYYKVYKCTSSTIKYKKKEG